MCCYTFIFQGLFKNLNFRSVALVTKKVMGYFRFSLHRPDFHSPVPYPMHKKITKKSFKFLMIKTQKI